MSEKIYEWLKKEWFPEHPPTEEKITRRQLMKEYFVDGREMPDMIPARWEHKMSSALTQYKELAARNLFEKIKPYIVMENEDISDKEMYEGALRKLYEEEGLFYIEPIKRKWWLTPSYDELGRHKIKEYRRQVKSSWNLIKQLYKTNPVLTDGTEFRESALMSIGEALHERLPGKPDTKEDDDIYLDQDIDRLPELPETTQEDLKNGLKRDTERILKEE